MLRSNAYCSVMIQLQVILKCLCLLTLVLPASAFSDCCCVTNDCCVQPAGDGEKAVPACCAAKANQPPSCCDMAGSCQGCGDCECSVPTEASAVRSAEVQLPRLDFVFLSFESSVPQTGIDFLSTSDTARLRPGSHQQRQALLSVWRN